MRPLREVRAVVPAGIDDPDLVSGGNAYDRHVLDGLREAGWVVGEHHVPGAWPHPDRASLGHLSAVVDDVPRDGLLLVDGLVASCAADVLVPAGERLRLTVLVHLPLGLTDPVAAQKERRVLEAASSIVTTSGWTRRTLLDAYALDPGVVHVARPGVRRAELSPGTSGGVRLLCVGAVTAIKGHADLLTALALVADLPWTCVVAGSLDREPELVARLRRQLSRAGLGGRVQLVGPLRGDDLERAYAASDLLVLPSRVETFGMVVTEALAHGLPVVASAVGGVPEAVGRTDEGPPGLLVPPGRPEALAHALRCWLGETDLRERLRGRARQRRRHLAPWSVTAQQVSAALVGVRDA
ncbi:glycosyltransferase family 4 protein [Terrabacter aerolatus]|uniref:glycosyltransferase family 4 protein n=1 Tax=Terrabacter aerolatus TaxID=422442 RepID=UPI0011BDDE76|nr:glycosyltransferase family 4 protein [Terrabacter aerolatus]